LLKTKGFEFGIRLAGGANSLPNFKIVENKGVAREKVGSKNFLAIER
jgi:hypothetical protein